MQIFHQQFHLKVIFSMYFGNIRLENTHSLHPILHISLAMLLPVFAETVARMCSGKVFCEVFVKL